MYTAQMQNPLSPLILSGSLWLGIRWIDNSIHQVGALFSNWIVPAADDGNSGRGGVSSLPRRRLPPPPPPPCYAALVFAINYSEEDAVVAAAAAAAAATAAATAASIDPPGTFNPAMAAMLFLHTYNLQLIIHFNSFINLNPVRFETPKRFQTKFNRLFLSLQFDRKAGFR